MTGPFRALLALTFAFGKAVLHGNIVLSIEVLSINGTQVFQERLSFFRKLVSVLSMFKIIGDSLIKRYRSLKRRANLKILVTVF